MEVYKVMIQNLLAYLQRTFKGVRVYIRATYAGHPNCKHAQGPYSDKLYEHDPIWHNWCASGRSFLSAGPCTGHADHPSVPSPRW